MVVFHLRMARGVGVTQLIPTLTSRRQLPTALFCGEKKGIDHGKIVMVRGCRFELCADGIGCSEWLLPYEIKFVVFGDSPDSPAWAEHRKPEVPHSHLFSVNSTVLYVTLA